MFRFTAHCCRIIASNDAWHMNIALDLEIFSYLRRNLLCWVYCIPLHSVQLLKRRNTFLPFVQMFSKHRKECADLRPAYIVRFKVWIIAIACQLFHLGVIIARYLCKCHELFSSVPAAFFHSPSHRTATRWCENTTSINN